MPESWFLPEVELVVADYFAMLWKELAGLPIDKTAHRKALQPRFRLEREEAMTYAVLIERGPTSFGATVPDLPGCVAVADTREEVERLIQQAIVMHLKGLREDGLTVPTPVTQVASVDVA